MVFKKTSKTGFVFPRSERPSGAFLADFDFDGAILKSDHRDWLRENVIDPAKAKHSTSGHWQIDLIGRASKKGSDEHNLALSGQRVKAVEAYLGPALSGVPFNFVPHQLGESSPWNSGEFDHELDRSVEVIARFVPVKAPKRPKPHILIPKIHIWKPSENRKVKNFRLQVLKAYVSVRTLDVKFGPVGFGNGDASVKMLIEIREIGSSDKALYEYIGAGRGTIIGAGMSLEDLIPRLGLSGWTATYEKGETHLFRTDVEMDADEFAKAASFQFDLLGRTLKFGPTPSFFSRQEKIKNLSFGTTRDVNFMKYAEATTFGEMSIVESVPAWAV